MNKFKTYALSTAFMLLLSSQAHAEFAMSEMVVDFGPDAPRQHDIELISQDKETQYIATETSVVENAGLANEKRVEVSDPQKSGLLLTPSKMVLAPSARKQMRLLLLKPQAETDQVYRLVVKPVVGEVEAGKERMALKVLVGYEALIIVRPKVPAIDLKAVRKGNALTLSNSGNTNANLQSGQQCDATGSNCKELTVSRIYAGGQWTTTLPYLDGVAKYQVWNGVEMKEYVY